MKRDTVGFTPAGDGKRDWLAEKSTLILPVDSYEDKIFPGVLQRADNIHIVLAPSMGQHYTNTASFWCGRTSSCMVENLRILSGMSGNDDPKDQYVAMRLKGSQWNLRDPSGQSMYYINGDCAPDARLKEKFGYEVLATLHSKSNLNPSEIPVRKNDPDWVHEIFQKSGILTSIRAGNPVVYYSRFSNGEQHIILLSGCLTLNGHLWFMVLNPAPNSMKMTRPFPAQGAWSDVNQYDLIEFQAGDWARGLGGIGLIRAGRFFDAHHSAKGKLYYESGSDTSKGGRYSLKTIPTAVPDELIITGVRKPLFHFPIDLKSASPLAYLSAVERFPLVGEDKPTAGGFYPIGLEGKLHAGVHLRALREADTPVAAMAPGEVVAIRMGARGNSSQHDKVQAMQRNWTNFVLLRHELLVGKDKPETKTFYSLYMHLAPPAWWQVDSSQEPGSGVDVPWLRRWTQGRYGALVKVGSNPKYDSGFKIGDVLALSNRLDPSLVSERYLIRVPEGELSIELDVWNPDPKIDGKKIITVPPSTSLADAVWIYFPPPPHLDLVCQALEQGKTLFLDGHFLSVANGETIGVVAPFNPQAPQVAPPPGTASSATRIDMSRSFVHWEVFATQDKLFENLAKPFEGSTPTYEVFEAPADAKTLAEKLNEILKSRGLLAADEQGIPVPTQPQNPSHPGILAGFFESASQGSIDKATLHLNLASMPKPSQFRSRTHPSGIPKYQFKVRFLRLDKTTPPGDKPSYQFVGKEQTLELTDSDWSTTETDKDVEFSPEPGCSVGDVEIVQLEWESKILSVVKKGDAADWKAYQERLKPLWRNLLVKHDSEWTPEKAKELILPEEKEELKPTDLGWWSAENILIKPSETMPSSLDALPKGLPDGFGDGKGVTAIHPVAFKWLLELAHRKPDVEALQFRDAWTRDALPKADRSKYTSTATILGFDKSKPIPSGGELKVMALDNFYYASGMSGNARMRLESVAGTAPSLDLEIPFGEHGVARADFQPDVWGDWGLYLIEGLGGEESKKGPISIKFQPPELDNDLLAKSVHQPLATVRPDVYRWSIPWKPDALGEKLHGIVELHSKIGGEWVPAGIGAVAKTIPMPEPTSPLAPETGWKLNSDWIEPAAPNETSTGKPAAAKPSKLTANFLLSDWIKVAPPDGFKLHSRLARSIQDLRAGCGAITVTSLGVGGTECVVSATDANHADQLENSALRLGLFSAVEKEVLEVMSGKKLIKKHQVRLGVEPGAKNHTLIEFDLGPALDCLVQNGVGGLGAKAGFVSGVAGKTSGLLGKVEAIGKTVPGGSDASESARVGGDAAGKLTPDAMQMEYTVGFHLLPSHFLNLADRNSDPENADAGDDLLDASEWADLAKFAGFLGPVKAPAVGASGAPSNGPIGTLSTRTLGNLGSIGFGTPSIRQAFPNKSSKTHQLMLSCPITGAKPQWKRIGVRLRANLQGQEKIYAGTLGSSEATFALPWPESGAASLDVVVDGFPMLTDSDDPEKVVSTPPSLSVEIPLQPVWSDALPVLALASGVLTISIVAPGLKGTYPSVEKPIEGAEKVEVEVLSETGTSIPVRRTNFPKDIGFTYGDSGFRASVSVPGFSKLPEGRYTVAFKTAVGGGKRFDFEWRGRKLSAPSEVRVYDAGQSDLPGQEPVTEAPNGG